MRTAQNTRRVLLEGVLVGSLILLGCSQAKDSDRVEPDQAEVAESVAVTPAPASAERSEAEAPAESPAAQPPAESPASQTEQSATAAPQTPEPSEPTETAEPAPPTEVSSPADEVVPAATTEPTNLDGEYVAVPDTKAGLTKIGAIKCKMCHKIQYASWAESEHAARTPPLDCESCHGSGSEYKKKSIMSDPQLARAAGLVMPEASFCLTCHQDDWQEEMLQQAHAHE